MINEKFLMVDGLEELYSFNKISILLELGYFNK